MAEKKEIIPDLFSNMMQGDSEKLQIAKELFTEENIDMKTEMSDYEINIISRAVFMQEIFGLDAIGTFISKFERLRVSKMRQGRKEFVETVKNRDKEDSGMNLASLFKQGKI